MPSLALAISAKKDKSVTQSPPTPKLVIPPDLQSAVEFLFCLEATRTGEVPPVTAWFFAEAFASQQYRNFKTTPQLQHFLQGLIGASAYAGPSSLSTYYCAIVLALCMRMLDAASLETVESVYGIETMSARFYALCEWCLMYWGIREREVYISVTEDWIAVMWRRLRREDVGNVGSVGNVGNTGNPNTIQTQEWTFNVLQKLRKRLGKLGKAVDFLGTQ